MSTSALVTANRLFNLVALSYGLYFTIRWPPLSQSTNPNARFAGPAKFFTNWNLMLQVLFYFCCLYKQFTSRVRIDGRATTKRGLFYHALIFPCAIIVFTTFWGLYYYDRNLIFPVKVEKYIPPYINHIIHTLILPGALVEGALYNHPLPKFKSAFTALATVGVSYIAFVWYIGLVKNYWVYPFLTVMDINTKIVFFVFAAISGLVLLQASKVYHAIFWSKTGSKQKKKLTAARTELTVKINWSDLRALVQRLHLTDLEPMRSND